MSERNIDWLRARPTIVKDAWTITLCGFDGSEAPATASFIWPDDADLSIPKTMVLMSEEIFRELCRQAGHGVISHITQVQEKP